MSSMKKRQRYDRLVKQVPKVLAELLGIEPKKVRVNQQDSRGADLVLTGLGHRFAVEFKSSSSVAHVANAARQVSNYTKSMKREIIPVVAVPFMGEAGRKACEEADVGWLDLSGNARIRAKDLYIRVEGRPNRMRSPGRKSNLFSPKSSRVARWLLLHPGVALTQRQIARATSMDEGYVSRIMRRMESEAYVIRDDEGAVRLKEPDLLLAGWRERYRFSRHAVRRGHVPARSGDELLASVSKTLSSEGIGHAATGLAAAWILTRFASFRIVTVYLEHELPSVLLEGIGFREEPKGANLWLVDPDDEGVFHGAIEKDGLRCVHPVQAYLDLKGHPERSAEAAERLREEFLKWDSDD
jgi:hypothetical protein